MLSNTLTAKAAQGADTVPTNTVPTKTVLIDTVLIDTVLIDTVLIDTVPTNTVLTNAALPLAGIGAGAFAREGASAGTPAEQMAAALALPRIRPAASGVDEVHAIPVFGGTAVFGGRTAVPGSTAVAASGVPASFLPDFSPSGSVRTVVGGVQDGGSPVYAAVKASTEQFQQTTRIHPAAKGGVGPHPAREPDPV
jgi:hypothetical protein